MKAIDLSLSHKCYRLTADGIQEAEIEGIIACEGKKDSMMVCFYGDHHHHVVKKNAKSILNKYFFSYDDALKKQEDLKFKSLCSSVMKKARAEKNYKVIQQLQKELKQ